jgi:hypothetical protein
LILNELGICQGAARVDMAVVNGSLNGYEIKSDKDTLERLPLQIKYYSQVFDNMAIVVGEKHLGSVSMVIPEWWSIIVVTANDENFLTLNVYKKGSYNSEVDPYALSQVLWKEEAIEILKKYNLQKGYISKSRDVIWKRLSDNLSIQELKDHVRHTLKSRTNWRVD